MKFTEQSYLRMFISFTMVAGLILSACGSAPSIQPPFKSDIVQSQMKRVTTANVAPKDLEQLVKGNNAFALDFYQSIRTPDGNLFYSPYSISLALAMTYAGARNETASQMAETLKFILDPEALHPAFNVLDLELVRRSEQAGDVEEGQRFQLNLANSIWGQRDYPFLPAFLDLLAVNYGAGLQLADFINAPEEARIKINGWVSEQTKEKINDLIQEGLIDTSTRLVLANAIYFKAAWLYPFEETLTQDGMFTLLDGSKVNVPMMSLQEPAAMRYSRGDDYQALALAYKGDMAEMIILLPDEGKFDGFEASLTAMRLDEILAEMETKTVALSIPKFRFASDYNLNQVLTAMGMPDAFNPNLADFSGIDGTRSLFIGAVVHKALVSVDEAGTEAAAATAVIMDESALILSDVTLQVDRPFIFVIRDATSGSILFMGRVVNPASTSE